MHYLVVSCKKSVYQSIMYLVNIYLERILTLFIESMDENSLV